MLHVVCYQGLHQQNQVQVRACALSAGPQSVIGYMYDPGAGNLAVRRLTCSQVALLSPHWQLLIGDFT